VAEASIASANSRAVHAHHTGGDDDARVISVARLRSVHPWVRARTVVFADDTIGVTADGEPARVDQDVVVTAIVPARDGGVLVLLREFEGDAAS
jgi:hypothetical protein